MMTLFHNRIVRMAIMSMFVLSLLLAPVVANVAFADQTPSGGQDAKIPTSSAVGNYIGNFMLNVTSLVTWFGGALLEKSIQLFILDTSTLIRSGTQFGQVIENIWKLVRDIANLAFIFGFIYIGLATIIKPDSQSTKRMIASIIIGALLINFSLFFVRFIVDVSNFLAVEIHNTMITGTGSISDKIGDALGMGSWFSPPKNDFGSTTRAGNVAFFFMGAIFLVVAGFVLAAGALLLITRFVALVFIMIFSPLMFAATVFPQTAHLAGRLWGELFRYAFFAPTYLFLLIISIQVLDGIIKILNSGKESTLEALQAGAIDVIAYFVLAIMFLIFSLQLAQKFGVAGANRVVGLGRAAARGTAFGAAGLLGRNAIRLTGARQLVEKQDEWRKSGSRLKNFGALAMRFTGTNAAANAAYNAKFGSSQSRADVVKQDKEINRERAKNRQASVIDTHISAGASGAGRTPTTQQQIDMERSISGASTEQLQALLDKYDSGSPEYNALVQNMSTSQFDSLMKLKPEDLDDGKKKTLRDARARLMAEKHNINQPATQNRGATTHGDIGKADAGELDALDFNTLTQYAGHLSSKQIDDMKSLTPTAKKTLKDARKSALVAELKPNGGASTLGTAKGILDRFTSDNEKSKLPAEILTNEHVVQQLSSNVLSKILDNDSLSPTERDTVKTHINSNPNNTPLKQWLTSPKGATF